jgi:hypothetical protein
MPRTVGVATSGAHIAALQQGQGVLKQMLRIGRQCRAAVEQERIVEARFEVGQRKGHESNIV